MTSWHSYVPEPGGEAAFAIDASPVTFGPGCLAELGETLRGLGGRRVLVFTDPRVAATPWFPGALASLTGAGVDHAVFDEVVVEPTLASFAAAAAAVRAGPFDAFASIGGGSVLDTAKAAILLATHPREDPLDYVDAPIGRGAPVPGPLPPHVACPTTAGTGSEGTGVAVCGLPSASAKSAIVSRHLRPSRALVDPRATETLPRGVVVASGFGLLAHALEAYTARPFVRRPAPAARPPSPGRSPWSDLGAARVLELAGRFLLAAVEDPADVEARHAMSFAATLAGVALGSAHLPRALAHAVAGRAKGFSLADYPAGLVPHGVGAIVGAPSTFRVTGALDGARHLEAAGWLGADVRGLGPGDGGAVLAHRLHALMRRAEVPPGLTALGLFGEDVPALVAATLAQRRLLDDAPLPVDAGLVERIVWSSM